MPQIYVTGKPGGIKWDVVPQHPMITYVSSDNDSSFKRGWGYEINSFRSDDLRAQIKARCTEQIKSSEWLLAYLDAPDSYESIAEIAFASAAQVPCFVAVNTTVNANDAYLIVGNFPNVFTSEVKSVGQAMGFFGINLGSFVCESNIERALWFELTRFSSFPLTSVPKHWPTPQFAISRYRLDFAWPNQKLAVEVDGHNYHKTKEQRSYDAQRDRDLLRLGWTTIRFTGSDVFKNAKAVAKEIMSIVDGGNRDEH